MLPLISCKRLALEGCYGNASTWAQMECYTSLASLEQSHHVQLTVEKLAVADFTNLRTITGLSLSGFASQFLFMLTLWYLPRPFQLMAAIPLNQTPPGFGTGCAAVLWPSVSTDLSYALAVSQFPVPLYCCISFCAPFTSIARKPTINLQTVW